MDPISEKQLTLFRRSKITTAETDLTGRIRLGALVNLLIQSAIDSADVLGFGFEGVRAQQLFWVLSRLTLEIERPLKWREEVEVETWPKDVDRLLYLRDYKVRIKDAKDPVARATSGWLAVDLQSRRPKKIKDDYALMLNFLKDKHALTELPEKLQGNIQGDPFHVQPTYFDLDLNQHVTATRYIDWMMDTFPLDFHKAHYPRKLSINYLRETLPGDSISLVRQEVADQVFRFESMNEKAGTKAFLGEVVFE